MIGDREAVETPRLRDGDHLFRLGDTVGGEAGVGVEVEVQDHGPPILNASRPGYKVQNALPRVKTPRQARHVSPLPSR